MPPDFDPTDPMTVPAELRKEAFNAAMVALQQTLAQQDARLDAIAELQLIDVELAETYRRLEQLPPVREN
jgi:hypothetical protein